MNQTHRREFLKEAAVLGIGLALSPHVQRVHAAQIRTTQTEPDGFFTLGIQNNHWWLITPKGKPFFTIGLNHIDPASLRYPENIHIWAKNMAVAPYGGSRNPLPQPQGLGLQHSRLGSGSHGKKLILAFTIDEYRTLKMPYCHLLPFTESHQWEKHTVHYDFRSEEWNVDYVARSHCAELAAGEESRWLFLQRLPNMDSRQKTSGGPIFDQID